MRVFSGVRPTDKLHIGNYLGAIKQWLVFQEKSESVFCIVDLHGITTPYNPKTYQKEILDKAIEYLACGLDPEKCIIFVQSKVKEHAELAWILGTVCQVGELQRMTQYKEKKQQHKSATAGLLNYPILMASDILLYRADVVPIGKDQVQHLELTRILAKRFNTKFGNTLIVPKPFLPKLGAKIMALNDPKKKMSKSMPETCLFLFDEPKNIKKKIMSAVTDTGKTIKYDPKKKPGISNLLTIYSLFADRPIKEIEKEFDGKGYADLKKSLIKLLINELDPLRKKRKELLNRPSYVEEILNQGERKARVIAQATIDDVHKKMGLTQ
jgi:tryptophanyl-tRNA synthetase